MTTPTPASIGWAFVDEARRRLADRHERIRHCLAQLDDRQVWWRPRPAMNSVANIVLHLCGNLRQWLVAGIGGAPDVRDRPQEFAERAPIPRDELLRRLAEVVAEADAALVRVGDGQLLEPRRIQGFDVTVLSAVFDCLTHLAGHTQEIIYITRLQLGDLYQFAWEPSTPEQGAPPTDPGHAVEEATDLVFEQGGPDLLGLPPLPGVPPPVAPAPAAPEWTEPVPPHHESPLGDYVRDLGEEFQEEEDETKRE
jgi:hypothetical protein